MVFRLSKSLLIIVLLLTASTLLALPVAAQTGSFYLSTSPSGATCFIDGTNYGPTPCAVDGLTPGNHQLRVELAGYETVTTTVSIVANQMAAIDGLVLTPNTPQTGSFYLTSNPSGATCFIDGTNYGPTPCAIDGLSAGDHQLRVELAGYETVTTTVSIVADQSANIDGLVLTPSTSGSQTGSIAITSTPAGASVYIDGVLQGVTPVTVNGLAPGSRIVKIGKDGYDTSVNTVTVSEGQTAQVNANLVSQTNPTATTTTVNAVQTTPVAQTTTLAGTVQTTQSTVTSAPTATPRITSQQTATVTTARSGSSSTNTAGQSATSGTGSLSVTTQPAGAQIYLDGVLIGNSPTTSSGLVPGAHTLQLKMTGYQDLSVPVSITSGQTTQYSSSLIRATTTTATRTPGFATVTGVLAVAGLLGARRILRR